MNLRFHSSTNTCKTIEYDSVTIKTMSIIIIYDIYKG
jgi:hypothetical protein